MSDSQNFGVLVLACSQLRGKADDEVVESVAKIAATVAPKQMRAKFASKEANEKLARWCRYTAKQVADTKRDISEVRLDLDEQMRAEGQSPEAVELLRHSIGRNRGEIVQSLLKAALRAETTEVSEYEVNKRITKAIVSGEIR